MAVAAPTLGPIIGLLGSFCLSISAIIYPAVVDMCVYYPDQYGPARYKIFLDILIILFGFACCVCGVYTSLLEMKDELAQ